MLRAIKIRLYPNKTQEQVLNSMLGCYRFIYNYMLARKQEAYKTDKTNLGITQLSKHFHHELLRDEQYAWLKEQNTKIMNQAIRQMDSGYQKFFKQHNGFPKFKSKKDKQSALFPKGTISKKNTFDTRKITLTTKLKDISFRCSDLYLARLRRYKNNIRSATLSKTKSGNFFLSVLIDIPQSEILKFNKTGRDVGIDLGVKDFVITSDGNVFENKHFYKKDEKRLVKLKRRLSKKHKGSSNFYKQCKRIAKVYETITNKKDAYIHSVVNKLLSQYDTIYIEDLNVQGIMKNHKLAKVIQEVGFYKFKTVLVTRALQNNKNVIFIGRYYPSSKTCSNCSYVHKDLKLQDRHWCCPKCNTNHDRDYNAALNILYEGRKISAV